MAVTIAVPLITILMGIHQSIVLVYTRLENVHYNFLELKLAP